MEAELKEKILQFIKENTRNTNPQSYKPLLKYLGWNKKYLKELTLLMRELRDCVPFKINVFNRCFSVYYHKQNKKLTTSSLPKRILRKKDKTEYIVVDGKYEHREVYKQYNGNIQAGWDVHHIDRDKTNNTIENLIALPHNLHFAVHQLDYRKRERNNKTQLEALLKTYLNFMNCFYNTKLVDAINNIKWEKTT